MANALAKLLGIEPPDDSQYYEAIGRFIVAYAQTECILHELARKFSKLKDERARVIFSGMRLGDLTSRLRALLRISGCSKSTLGEIEACLKQLDVIGLERDKMVHRYSHYEMGSITISNQMTAKSLLTYERDAFTIIELGHLNLDCLGIYLRLAHILHPPAKRKMKREAPSTYKSLHAPWRYKPPPRQTPKRRKAIQKVAAALQSQSQSSLE